MFKDPTMYHGYEMHMLKKWQILTLENVNIRKSQFAGYQITNLSDENQQLINKSLSKIHERMSWSKSAIYLRTHPNIKIADLFQNNLVSADQIHCLPASVQIDLQGFKKKDGKILPIWRINKIGLE